MGPNLSLPCDCMSVSLALKSTSSCLDPRLLQQKLHESSSRPDSFTSSTNSEGIFNNQSFYDSNSSSPHKTSIKDFVVQKVLGKGASGKVLLVTNKLHSLRFYAMKIIQKSQVYANNLSIHIKLEKETLKNSNSPFIVKLNYSFQTPTKIYLVMEYISGGDLFQFLRKKKRFSLQTAKFYLSEVILALDYLHNDLKLIYRDLKPENILIALNGHLKITDFGLAKNSQEKCVSIVGTPEYAAPEVILNQEQTTAVDIWSCGVLLFEMMAGFSPFSVGSKSSDEIQNKILKENVKFPSFFTEESKDLIGKMMRKNPNERIILEEIKKHRFFEDIDWKRVQRLDYQAPYKADQEKFKSNEQKELNESYDLNSLPDLEGLSFNTDDKRVDI